jgi:phosphoribosyl-ATP pyrophosphohydrolase
VSVGFDVERFMRAVGQAGPVDDEKRLIAFRISLIDEEYDELIQALHWGDRALIAKEAADLVYVAVGTCVALGIPFDDVWNAVQESNMSKLDEDGNVIKSPDGKILKGSNYKGPEKRIEQLVKQS